MSWVILQVGAPSLPQRLRRVPLRQAPRRGVPLRSRVPRDAGEAPRGGRGSAGGLSPFTGRYAFKSRDFESVFGREAKRLVAAAEALGAEPVEKADVAVRISIFPKLPVELLLWLADEEFPAKLTILFDRTLPRVYPVDAISTVVNLLLGRLVMVGRG